VSNRPFFEIGLEKDTAPVYPVKLHESFCSWDFDQTSLKKEY
jgi:hypothetical protein